MLDGTVFKRLLNVKNQGEWMSMLDNIYNDHFVLKNFYSFERMETKIRDFLINLEQQLPNEKFEQQSFVANFREIFEYKFRHKLDTLVEVTLAMVADILYIVNQSPGKLLYYYPESVMDPLLIKHLETVIPINKDHVKSLTKVSFMSGYKF